MRNLVLMFSAMFCNSSLLKYFFSFSFGDEIAANIKHLTQREVK